MAEFEIFTLFNFPECQKILFKSNICIFTADKENVKAIVFIQKWLYKQKIN